MSGPAITAASSTDARANGNFVVTKIFIDQVPEYDLLKNCAESKVSAIVRGMSYGCGDGNRMTSYGCFCYSSSTFYDNMISGSVATACDDQSQITTAQDVFHKYCQIGQTKGIAPTPVSASLTSATAQSSLNTSLSSAASGPSIASSVPTSQTLQASSLTPTSTPFSLSTTPSPANSGTNATVIAAAVSIPIVIIALLVATFFFYRYRKRSQSAATMEKDVPNMAWKGEQGHSLPSTPKNDPYAVELAGPEKGRYMVAELPVQKSRYSAGNMPWQKSHVSVAELPGHDSRIA